MFQRELKFPKRDSCFLFGARGTGKSTWLRHVFPHGLYIDLLDSEIERELTLHPTSLGARIRSQKSQSVVIIDEIQKLPSLLDEVHPDFGGYRRQSRINSMFRRTLWSLRQSA